MGHSGGDQLNNRVLQVTSWISIFALGISPALGQVNPSGNTTKTTEGAQIQITGGERSVDGANLFHQFESFDINQSETVIFVAPDSVENILSRITNLQPSSIDGNLVVSNNANFWLINPAGILFGPDARLNLQGDFTAATADAVGFDQGWFTHGADYQALVGSPRSLAFVSAPAPLINLGDLQVSPGQHLRLLGGSVINGGNLSAPEGTITIAAVTNTNLVTLSQSGQILSLDIASNVDDLLANDLVPLDLPTLLTGSGIDHADTLTVTADGAIQLGQATTFVPKAGDTAIMGTLSTAGIQGGQVAILGERVALVDATITADGTTQGGHIYVGGNYQGRGPLPNATQTVVNQETVLSANALEHGNGGEIIVWADEATNFSGSASAQGGVLGGDGGFIEISGKSYLGFDGEFSLAAPLGNAGTILFDPDNIRIEPNGTTAQRDAEFAFFPTISAMDGDGTTLAIHERTLEEWSGDDNIILQANDNIFINLGNHTIGFQPGVGSITFIADADGDNVGDFLMTSSGDRIRTSGRDLSISGENVLIEAIDTRSTVGGGDGDFNLEARNNITIEDTIDANNISLRGNTITIKGGNDSISGTTFSLETADPNRDIYIGSSTNTPGAMNLDEGEILSLKDGFTNISIGRADGAGAIILHDSVADGGAAAFKDPVTILGAGTLQGPEQLTPWTITGNNQGNLNSIFGNGLSFENIDSIVAGNNSSDTIKGSGGNDTITLTGANIGQFNNINFTGIHSIQSAGGDDRFIFNDGASISGLVDGGAGNNTLDYGAYTTNVTIDLETSSAPGTGGFSNIQQVIGGSGSNNPSVRRPEESSGWREPA
ncbi:MAG: filamentous hemagglutinin N-terminal domain-containing protein [Leptolyngbya sp. SIO3F4]|nr:filamentous hemagglutinin N-terminal domain-containing protein [Leptolyngbya sp. SIO3F4]